MSLISSLTSVLTPVKTFSPIFLQDGTSVLIPELGIEVYIETAVFADNIHKSFTEYLFKTTDVYGKISIRPRKIGDVIKLRGTNCIKTLKKLFTEKRIPLVKRATVPIIADEKGVLGVYGVGSDARAAPAIGDTIYIIKFKEIQQK